MVVGCLEKKKENFGHNGWGGSLGFGDPIEGIGVSYVTRKINASMGADIRAVNLIKSFTILLKKIKNNFSKSHCFHHSNSYDSQMVIFLYLS